MQALAARDKAQEIADGIGVVQSLGESPTAVMSQKAVTEEVNKLSEEIDDAERDLRNVIFDIASGSYIDQFNFEDGKMIEFSTKTKVDFSSGKVSEPISLKRGMKIKVYTPSYPSISVISLCENGSYTPVVRGNNSTTEYMWYLYEAQKDCEVVVTLAYDYGNSKVNAYLSVDDVQKTYDFLCDDFEPIGIPTFDNGYFSYNQNKLTSVYSHKAFDVVGGEVYKVGGYSHTNVMVVVLTDGVNVVDYYPKEETQAETYHSFTFEIPPNATKMYVNRMVKGTTNREYFVSVYKRKGFTQKHHDIKKLTIIGDSLSIPFSGVPLPYHKLLEAHDNFIVENLARSGHGYYHDKDQTYAFWRQAERVTHDTDVCLIFGSFNDMEEYNIIGNVTDTSEATICGCVNKTFNTLLSNNVGLKVGVILPTPWGNHYPEKADSEDYVSKIITICRKRGIPYLDLFHCSGLRPWESAFDDEYYHNSDACHPNSKGHEEYIYPHVREFVKSIVR
jgi:hypothetical protein